MEHSEYLQVRDALPGHPEPSKMAMKFSGDKTESVYRRYDIVSQQDMKLAAAKMENYLEGLKSQAITTKTTTVEEKPN